MKAVSIENLDVIFGYGLDKAVAMLDEAKAVRKFRKRPAMWSASATPAFR